MKPKYHPPVEERIFAASGHARTQANSLSRRGLHGLPLFLAYAVYFLGAAWAFAQTSSPLIPFQGRLTDQQGRAYTNGQFSLTFSLYSQAVGGTPLWTERHQKVGVINGMVNVFLGSINSLTNQDFSQTRHLGITIDADDNPTTSDPEMVPRQMIIPAFWAKQAENSTLLAGTNWSAILVSGNNPATGFIRGDRLQVASITTERIATDAITSDKIAPGEVKNSDIGNGEITVEKLAPTFQLDTVIPPGTIQAYGGHTNTIPLGWLPCDGRAVSGNQYPRLFSAISTNWGAGIPNSTNNFNVPDLRGMFLRGVSGFRDDGWQDVESAGRSNSIPVDVAAVGRIIGGNSGNQVGSTQPESTRRPTAAFNTSTNGAHTHTFRMRVNGDDNSSDLPENGTSSLLGTATTSSDGNHAHTIVAGGDLETRPKNAYVHFIIKY